MPNFKRVRHTPSDTGDFDDDLDDDFSAGAGQEKLKLLLFDLLGRWHWIALGLILGVLGGLYYLSKAPKVYEAQSTVLVKQQAATVMGSDQVEEISLRSAEGLNTVAERLRRAELMQKVASRPDIRELPGLIPEPVEWIPGWALKWFGKDPVEAGSSAGERTVPPPAALAGRIAGWTSVGIRKGTRLLDISVNHQSPTVAKALADAIAIEYQAELMGARTDGRSTSLELLVRESEQAKVRLQLAQNALANYERVLATLKELETREEALLQLTRRYLPKHPKMISAGAEVETFKDRFLSEFDSIRNATADKDYWDTTTEDWEQTADDPKAKLQTARRLLVARAKVLGSEIESQTRVFNGILTRIQEADINQQATESEMEISSLAQLPGAPVSPKPPQTIAAASLGGLGLGVLIALCFIKLDNKFHTVAQAERETGLPVLAAVSNLDPKILAAAVKKRKIDLQKIPQARKLWDPHLVFREGVTSTTFAEMFRVLRASVALLGDEKKRKINLFSSALPGEGKTTVSANFALASAQQGKRTLLIDLDLRKPAVHKIFGLKRDSHAFGSTEVLAGQAAFKDAIYTNTGEENLHIILSGKRAPNPGELLNGATLSEFLETAASLYDTVVVDSAPLLAVPDTRIIAPLADNFCLVTRAEYVPKGAVRRVLSLLEGDQTLPSGIVFNGFEEKRRLVGQNYSYGNYQTNRYGKMYRYGYGSYGAYGAYGSDDDD